MTNIQPQTGTVISATNRPQDLIPAFLEELRTHDKEQAEKIAKDIPHSELIGDDLTINENHPWWISEEASWILWEELIDALNEHAPEGCYFGAHDGDGSDFGYWECEPGFPHSTRI